MDDALSSDTFQNKAVGLFGCGSLSERNSNRPFGLLGGGVLHWPAGWDLKLDHAMR
jgi:hypothetical protein